MIFYLFPRTWNIRRTEESNFHSQVRLPLPLKGLVIRVSMIVISLAPILYIWATTCDFQQCGILTSVDSDEPVQPPSKLRTPNDVQSVA